MYFQGRKGQHRLHRRRVRTSLKAGAVAVLALGVIGGIGLEPLSSGAPASASTSLGTIGRLDVAGRYFHEILSYTALELNLDETFLHRWADGKSDD